MKEREITKEIYRIIALWPRGVRLNTGDRGKRKMRGEMPRERRGLRYSVEVIRCVGKHLASSYRIV